MMCGRAHARRRRLRRRPGFRRGKQFDVFRQKPGEVQEGILLDDPALDDIDIEDLMSFCDQGFQGDSNARYTQPKWATNQWRAILNNSLNPGAEQPATETHEETVVSQGYPTSDDSWAEAFEAALAESSPESDIVMGDDA